MKRKRKAPIPILLLWSKGEQLRFIDAVEKLVNYVRDLGDQVEQLRSERAASQRKYERRKARRNCQAAGGELQSSAEAIDASPCPGPSVEGGGES